MAVFAGDRARIWALLVVALVLVACGPEAEPAFPRQPYFFPQAATEAQHIDRAACSITVDKRRMSLEQAMREYNVQGVSAAAMVGGQVVWARAWGYADSKKRTPLTPETVLQAASVSKPLSAVGVMRMVQARKLNLDADVSTYLDGWEARYKNRHVPITLRQLMSHSAGLNVHGFGGYPSTVEDLPSTIDILNGKGNSPAVRCELAPGTEAKYSGGGFTVVQAVVEAEVEEPFDAAMYQWLIKPFRMTHSTFEQPIADQHKGFTASAHGRDGRPIRGRYHVYPMQAAAGLWTTPTDLLTVAGALSNAYNGAPGPLSQAMVKMMLTPTSASGSIGIGWYLAERNGVVEATHNGQNEGFTSAVAWRTDGLGAAVMVNGDGPIASGLLRAIAEEYGWRERTSSGCAP
ncbi:MAG: beta-lactamase family protein [Polyangiaceae bacterium]|nr:beta-lactamase family protein [Polyangiaceae bacterium]